MPILDPVSQIYLNRYGRYDDESKHGKTFYLRYLKIASRNLYRNSKTIEASIQFKKDFKNSISFLNQHFGCDFNENFDDSTIKDYYQYLYDHISPKYKTKIPKNPKGKYFYFYENLKMNCFQPNIDYQNRHSWFFTQDPVAILTVNEESFSYRFKKAEAEKLIKLINLEIDLMKAAGFTVVFSYSTDLEKEFFTMFINDVIATHSFAEIHLTAQISKIVEVEKSEKFFQELLNVYDNVKGYFYFYSKFIKDKFTSSKKIFKQLKQKPRFKYIFFSKQPYYALQSLSENEAKPFSFCKTGFESDQICVRLCNIPLYKTEDEEEFLISNITKLSEGYISAKDFLNFEKTRVKILFKDINNNDRYIPRYIDFDDLHSIKSDLYVDETMYLAKTDKKTLELIDKIESDIDDKDHKYDDFKKVSIFSFFKEKKMQKGLSYVSFAYLRNAKKTNPDFKEIHKNQLLAAIEACQTCIFKEKRTSKGVVYQVETGEGKSCIIQIIAAVLALMKKTVHITSSNITLSNRDYYNSFHFFKMLGLSSAVLLHYNELPYVSFNKSSSSNDNKTYDRKYFPRKYFSSKLFQNSSNMNFSVCGINSDNEVTKDKANIIFSTFVNFESLYLRMMEMCPGYIDEYFKSCSLLIDEADSILIDELTNGTILSRTIKTNANDILKYVYQSQRSNVPVNEVLKYIKNQWPECVDLKLKDIEFMYEEIALVNLDEFIDGKKYSVEEIEVKDESNILDAIKKAYETGKIKAKRSASKFFSKLFKKNKSKDKDKDQKEKSKEKSHKSKEKENQKFKTIKAIIPFDYDHKGILEPNKEFSGFVQQFIAIKEMINKEKENQNMVIKDVSMNYLFVSHPIFVKMYGGVVGLTGTIGNKYDKQIFKDQYDLVTMKIPRENPNLRVEYPTILCEDINERNQKIAAEVIDFHNKDYPVLVIFQDLNEISAVLYILISNGIKNINIFDGKDEKVKPDLIAGLKGAVSLGTNVCGRGTDIQKPVKPLHVIISYFTSNSRVMYQAFGRTARQGQEGSVRIICVKEEYLLPIIQYNNKDMNSALDDFKFKNDMQIRFIEGFREKRKWIFAGGITSQKFADNLIATMREVRINANRIKVCNFQFPICMSIPTFLSIQAQKIFSLFNCPNCKYTWMLFQKYIREMILESWSLMIDNLDKKYFKKKRNVSYSTYFENKVTKINGYIKEYLPDSADPKNYEIIPTFMHIFLKVVSKFQLKIMSVYPEVLTRVFRQPGTSRFASFTVGFKPYSLVDESGARINTADGTNQELNYISDPELKYMQKQPSGRSLIISITEKIDGIFNWICRKINDVIGSYIGLKFFLRRTLAGCEFGVCLDLDLEFIKEKSQRNFNCLIDQDPLLVFTISVRSLVPLLAGILIIGLVYIAAISGSIAEWITAFPAKITGAVIKKTLITVASSLLKGQIEKICEAICAFLIKILDKNIKKLSKFSPEMAEVFSVLMKISGKGDFKFSGDKVNEVFNNKAKINMKTNFGQKFVKNNIPFSHFLKVGFLIMLCFASFMLNFHFHRRALKYNDSKEAKEYDDKQDPQKALEENKKQVKSDSIGKPENINDELLKMAENKQ